MLVHITKELVVRSISVGYHVSLNHISFKQTEQTLIRQLLNLGLLYVFAKVLKGVSMR